MSKPIDCSGTIAGRLNKNPRWTKKVKYECEIFKNDFILHLYFYGVPDSIQIKNPKILYIFALIKHYDITSITPQDGMLFNQWFMNKVYPKKNVAS